MLLTSALGRLLTLLGASRSSVASTSSDAELAHGRTVAQATFNAHLPHQAFQAPYAPSGVGLLDRQPLYQYDELLDMTTYFLDHFIHPKNADEAKKINSTIFTENVLGRVDATRTFDGRELNTEYAFGLFANMALDPGSFSLLGVPIAYNITHFSATQNIIAAVAIVEFKIVSLGVVVPVELDFWATFDGYRQMSQYDATFRYLQWQFEHLYEITKVRLGLNSTEEVQTVAGFKIAESICKTTQQYCTGQHRQYDSVEHCMHFLTSEIRFGQAHELGMNTLLCRMVHQNMVPARPGLHCYHVGPNGGGYCNDDRSYPSMVRQNYFQNAPFVPSRQQA